MGADFLLKALGIPDDQLAALKAMLNPENVRGLIANFSQRFNEMEQRNMAMHQAIMQMAARSNPLPVAGIAAYAPQSGDVIPPIFMAEIDRQTAIFEAKNNDGNDSNGNHRNGHEHANGNGSDSSAGSGEFSFGS